MTAKQFMRTIGSAAKAGVESARHIGDSPLDASMVVAKTPRHDACERRTT